jgi:hypothetical protein
VQLVCFLAEQLGDRPSNRVAGGTQMFGASTEQQCQFQELFFKAMVTSCNSFNFVENGYLKTRFEGLCQAEEEEQHVSKYLDQCLTILPVKTRKP